MIRLLIILIGLLLITGCAKPWPDAVLPDTDSRAVLPDDVMDHAEPGSRFLRERGE